MMIKSFFLIALTLSMSEARVRCGLLAFVGGDTACHWSCKLWGHTSGSCDESQNCNCSEEPLSLRELLDGQTLGEFISGKISEFTENVDKWELTKNIKEKIKITSRCSISDDFCDTSCRAIGRLEGQCNADKSDCACSEQKIGAKQFALCLNRGICSLYCQSSDFARGECRGDNMWNCMCVSMKDGEEESEAPDLVDVVDVRTGAEEFERLQQNEK